MSQDREDAKGRLLFLARDTMYKFRPFWMQLKTVTHDGNSWEAVTVLARLLEPAPGRLIGDDNDIEFQPNDLVWLDMSGTYVMSELKRFLKKSDAVKVKDAIERKYTFTKEVAMTYAFKESKKTPGNYYKSLRVKVVE